MRKIFGFLLPFALIFAGVWMLTDRSGPQPDRELMLNGFRQRAMTDVAEMELARTAEQVGSEVYDYAPVQPQIVQLSDIESLPVENNGNYYRWLAGEIDLDEQDGRWTPAELQAVQEEALNLEPQEGVQSGADAVLAPTPGISFSSLDYNETGGSTPPDPHLAASPNHLIAVANVAFEIYDKQGNSLFGPASFSSLFGGTSGCTGLFDPTTLYDEKANRYILAIDADGEAFCIGVSATSDPTGAWHLYSFATDINGAFFDYPHIGVGINALYMGANQFLGNSFFEGRVWAMDKEQMYAGLPMTPQTRSVGGSGSTPQPMHLHGYAQGTWPSSGPDYFVTDPYDGDSLHLWSWSNALGGSAPSLVATLNLQTATGVTSGFPIGFPQQGGSLIQANDYRFRGMEYRNGSAWVADSISCNPGAGSVNCVRWAEIDLATRTIVQAGVLGDTGLHRTFPDLAVNQCEDMAIGYTRSSTSSYPGVWYTGRKNTDPAGTLQGEMLLKAGEDTYVGFDGSPYRWGDYTGMTIDPDGKTFWYLGQYSKNITAAANWGTYVGSISYPDCGSVPPPNLNEKLYVPLVAKNAGGGPPPPGPSIVCQEPGLSITDNSSTGVSDTAQVSSNVALSDLDVYLDVTHTWIGDLRVTLTHVDSGTVITLVDRPGVPNSSFGCSGDNIDATLDDNAASPIEDECDSAVPTIDGRFRPQQPLSAFNGEIYGGQWRLTISDNAGGDVGTLDEWCLEPNLTP
jgi:hypothetical protein